MRILWKGYLFTYYPNIVQRYGTCCNKFGVLMVTFYEMPETVLVSVALWSWLLSPFESFKLEDDQFLDPKSRKLRVFFELLFLKSFL